MLGSVRRSAKVSRHADVSSVIDAPSTTSRIPHTPTKQVRCDHFGASPPCSADFRHAHGGPAKARSAAGRRLAAHVERKYPAKPTISPIDRIVIAFFERSMA